MQIGPSHLEEFKDDDFADGIEQGKLTMPKEGWTLILRIIWKLISVLLQHRGKLRKEVEELRAEMSEVQKQLALLRPNS
jgi:hypothetical protein